MRPNSLRFFGHLGRHWDHFSFGWFFWQIGRLFVYGVGEAGGWERRSWWYCFSRERSLPSMRQTTGWWGAHFADDCPSLLTLSLLTRYMNSPSLGRRWQQAVDVWRRRVCRWPNPFSSPLTHRSGRRRHQRQWTSCLIRSTTPVSDPRLSLDRRDRVFCCHQCDQTLVHSHLSRSVALPAYHSLYSYY